MAKKYDLSAFDNAVAQNQEPEGALPPGMLESAGLGLAQGATFGFGDELYGAGAGLTDALSGDVPIDMDMLMEAYTKNRDAARTEMKAAEEENPWTFNTANLLGGFAVPAGALGAASKAATFGGRALQGLKAGAAAGALAGLGTSEADLTQGENLGQAGKEALTGAAIGGGLGAGASAIIPAAIKGTGDWIGKFKGAQKVGNAFQKAREGVEMFGSEAVEREAIKTKELAKEIGKEINAVKKYAGSVKGESLNNTDEVFLIDKYKELSEKLKALVPSSDEEARLIAKYQSLLDTMIQKTTATVDNVSTTVAKRPMATSEEIDKTTQALNKILYKNKNLPYEAKEVGHQLSDELSDLAKKGMDEAGVEKLKIGSEGYTKGLEAQAKVGGLPAASGTTLEARQIYEKQLEVLMDNIRRSFAKPGDSGAIALKEAFDVTKKNIETMNKKLLDMATDPDEIAKLKALGQEQLSKITNLEKQVKEQALNLSTSESMIGVSPFGGESLLKKVTGMSGEAATLSTARKLGQATRFVETNIPDAIKKLGQAVYSATPQQLQTVADKLAQKASPFASKVKAALSQPDRKRNAILFALMQQPGFRQDVGDIFGGE